MRLADGIPRRRLKIRGLDLWRCAHRLAWRGCEIFAAAGMQRLDAAVR